MNELGMGSLDQRKETVGTHVLMCASGVARRSAFLSSTPSLTTLNHVQVSSGHTLGKSLAQSRPDALDEAASSANVDGLVACVALGV